MTALISSIEDGSSKLYRGRANYCGLNHILAMADEAWRRRLQTAFDTSNKSKRSVSLEAGFGPGYLHSILVEGKDPTIEKLMAICDVLDVSVAYILHGIDATPNDIAILALIKKSPEKRDAILSLLSA